MNTFDRILIIIPTYNEVENIKKLIPRVLDQDPRLDILIIDDNSPDGTAQTVKRLMGQYSRVDLIKRPSKMGLGTAYVTGFRYALEKQYDLIFEMDADFSHDPKEIPKFLDSMNQYDLVIGSRYIEGVNVINWPMGRLLLSWTANLYTRLITGLPVRDATSGFKCFRKAVLEKIDLSSVRSDGYAFQIEMDYKAWTLGFTVHEIPIIFVDRNLGESKMNSGIVSEAVWMVWKLRWLNWIGRL